MRHVLRQLVQLILGGATPRAGTGMLTCSVTLASALWVSVSVPNLPLVRGLDGRAGTNVAISLQSALLGIDDRSGNASSKQALARMLGLSANVAKLLTPAALRESAYTTVRTAFEPITAQLGQSVAVEAVPVVSPPDAPIVRAIQAAGRAELGRPVETFYLPNTFDAGYANHVGIPLSSVAAAIAFATLLVVFPRLRGAPEVRSARRRRPFAVRGARRLARDEVV